MLQPRQRLMLVDDDPARRLELTAGLSASFDVDPVNYSDEPIKLARQRRPDMVLLVMTRRTSESVLRLCRTLRTDVRPVHRVGVLEVGSRPRGAWISMELWLSDGYLALPVGGDALVVFAEALWAGERPIHLLAEKTGGRVGRLLSRLRGA